ncbi:MAG TPA: hypothetical protein VFT48_09055 [Pyrinomonadaceae bacterium]|nr:hypothetical protein [Pyrinomonadaceae bacterium]
MPVQVILTQKGPLPISVTFNPPGDMPAILEVNGSVWTQTANQMIGIQVALDGTNLGQANIFSNGASTHRAVVPAYFKVQLKYGAQYKLVLSAAPGTTVSDVNDFFTAVIHY